ncbi:MAG TPA: GspE/PulE family protein [Candidatus Magasanikbacteria bacterium]|nr:GspE/PulE family protein [Candidatus Magasanikbacteria bacterium]
MSVEELLISSKESSAKFADKMKKIAIKEKEDETQKKAAVLGLPYLSLVRFPITAEAIGLIPQAEAERLKVVCFLFTGSEIRLGAVDPQNTEVEELVHTLEERHHSHAALYIISENSLQEAFKFYATLPVIKPISKDVTISDTELNRFSSSIATLAELKKEFSNLTNISDLVVLMIAGALKYNSSDIHIEAEEKQIVVRYRLDGILQETGFLNKDLWPRIVSRIKLLAGLKINITDKPQDGRFTIILQKEKTDVRVSALPTVHGESVVMRILKPMASLTFDQLGLQDSVLEALKKQVVKPTGMVVTTGPTGSGKTTTLYAILQRLNEPGVKIITLEDPVEYKLSGINQSQIDAEKDYTFAKGLRSILRQDPDIVMVGEIRDLETAETAIQAALTGHFMLSTIHTNSAAGAIPRFLSMGVKPFLLAPALNAIIGQRLVRRLCQKCKQPVVLEETLKQKVQEVMKRLPADFLSKHQIDLEHLEFFTAPGCAECNNLGYKGRMGIYELMEMNKELEQLILKSEASSFVIEDLAIKNGMITMAQDGILKALQGVTSVEEVFRVTQ